MARGEQHSADDLGRYIFGLRRCVVLSHVNPDPDAFGSSGGLGLALRAHGVTVAFVNESGANERLSWIPGAAEAGPTIPPGNWDALIVCDCGDDKRVGDSLRPFIQPGPQRHPVVVCIDHHISNDCFGDWNYVVPTASSTAELVYEILLSQHRPITKDIATALFAGISGDTGSFRYPSTSARVFEMAAKLVAAGAEPGVISEALYSGDSPAAVQLQAAALAEHLEILDGGDLALVTVSSELFVKYGASLEDADVLVDRARAIRGVRVSVVLKQDASIWRVSMRSRDAAVDLSAVAAELGGGGHRAAAAFRFRRDLSALRSELLPRLSKALASRGGP